MGNEIPRTHLVEKGEDRFHAPGRVPARPQLRVQPPDLRGAQLHPTPMETFTKIKSYGLGAVPRSHDDRAFGRHGVDGSLQGGPRSAGLEDDVSPPPSGGLRNAPLEGFRTERVVRAGGERQLAAFLQGIDEEHRSSTT